MPDTAFARRKRSTQIEKARCLFERELLSGEAKKKRGGRHKEKGTS